MVCPHENVVLCGKLACVAPVGPTPPQLSESPPQTLPILTVLRLPFAPSLKAGTDAGICPFLQLGDLRADVLISAHSPRIAAMGVISVSSTSGAPCSSDTRSRMSSYVLIRAALPLWGLNPAACDRAGSAHAFGEPLGEGLVSWVPQGGHHAASSESALGARDWFW